MSKTTHVLDTPMLEARPVGGSAQAIPRAVLVVLALSLLPMRAAEVGAANTTAQSLLAIEQMEAPFVAVVQTAVRRAPIEESRQIGLLKEGETLLVTGRVRGGFWYRIYSEEKGVGYVLGEAIASASAIQPVVGDDDQSQSNTGSSAEPAAAQAVDAPGVFRDCAGCPEMIPLPGGTYQMGSETGGPTEQPVRDVAIGYRYALSRYEVTVAEWMVCVTAGGCTYEPNAVPDPERTAVRNLSWDDAQEFVRWLSDKTGKAYRLPSEVEWEYAARAGTKTKYWWGDGIGKNMANCMDCGTEWNHKAPAPVSSLEANPFGLYGMNGGVAEWTGDCWAKNYQGAPRDGSVREKEDCQQRALRGGSWRSVAADVRSAFRFYYDANVNYSTHGMRVALTLK